MSSLFHKIKQKYLDARILLSYGQLNPDWVALPPYGHLVSINPRDNRARKNLLADTIRGKYRQNRDFWERACRMLSPDWAIDVGVNFGECLFLPRYSAHTNVLGIEANPELMKYLMASREKHPQAGQIDIQFGVAANESGKEVEFFINERWSGSSTVAIPTDCIGTSPYRAVRVPTLCIDELIEKKKPITDVTMVFKIDVEGYESHVMSGMSQVLAACKSALGFIEFDPTLLARAGIDAVQYFAALQNQFEVWMFTSPREIVLTDRFTLTQSTLNTGRKRMHTDLVLRHCVPDTLFKNLVSPWIQQTKASA
jgi:FkbM family methyltransferase